MDIFHSKLEGCFVLTPNVFRDDRGYFFESFNADLFKKTTELNIDFCQDNESYSEINTIRGLHYQVGKKSQSKLVRVVSGEILDVVVDLRKEYETYGQYFSVKISSENKKQLFVPKGFAHGFKVISKTALVVYKCDEFYDSNSERGIRYDDKSLNIDWDLIGDEKLIISDKDMSFSDFIL